MKSLGAIFRPFSVHFLSKIINDTKSWRRKYTIVLFFEIICKIVIKCKSISGSSALLNQATNLQSKFEVCLRIAAVIKVCATESVRVRPYVAPVTGSSTLKQATNWLHKFVRLELAFKKFCNSLRVASGPVTVRKVSGRQDS